MRNIVEINMINSGTLDNPELAVKVFHRGPVA